MENILILLRNTLGFSASPSSSVSMNVLIDEHSVRHSDIVAQKSILEEDTLIFEQNDKQCDVLTTAGSSLTGTAEDDYAENYAIWLQGDTDRLYQSWNTLQSDPENSDQARHLFLTAHNLKGTATGFGKPTISRICQSLCILLKRGQISRDLALINLHVDACRAAMAQKDGAPEIADAVCAALEAQVARIAA